MIIDWDALAMNNQQCFNVGADCVLIFSLKIHILCKICYTKGTGILPI